MWEIEAEHYTNWALEKFCWKWNGITNLTKIFRIISLIYILVLQLWLVCQYWYLWWIHLQSSRNGVWEGARQYKEAKILIIKRPKQTSLIYEQSPPLKQFKIAPKKNPALCKLRITVPQRLRLPHLELALPVETLMETVR